MTLSNNLQEPLSLVEESFPNMIIFRPSRNDDGIFVKPTKLFYHVTSEKGFNGGAKL